MRYFDFTVRPDEGVFHPVDRLIAETPSVTRRSIVHLDQLGDGTAVLLYRLEGDADVLVPDIGDHPDVLTYDKLEADDQQFHLYLHVRPGEPADTVLGLAQKYALMIDTPVEFAGRGSLEMTVIGDHETVTQAVEEFPPSLSVTVDEVGTYAPDRRDMLSVLTDRQLEVFRKAVELGYYEIPRRTTHEEIADHLGCAPSTVDEHLRKAESRVLRTLVG